MLYFLRQFLSQFSEPYKIISRILKFSYHGGMIKEGPKVFYFDLDIQLKIAQKIRDTRFFPADMASAPIV